LYEANICEYASVIKKQRNMELSLTHRATLKSRSIVIVCFVFIITLLFSSYLAFVYDPSNTTQFYQHIVLLMACFSVLTLFYSTKTWIPILICSLLVRDFSLGEIVGGGGLKIGDIFIALIFSILVLYNRLTHKSTTIIRSKLDSFVVLFLLFSIFSLYWSTDLEFGLVRILKLIRNLCFFIIIRDSFIKDFKGNYKRATVSFIVTGAVLMVVSTGIVLSAGGYSDFLALQQKEVVTSLDMGALRMRGTGGGMLISGPSAWYIITVIFVFGSLMLAKSGFHRLTKIIVVLIFLAATVTTLSRSSIVVVGIILAVLLLGSFKLRLRENIPAIMSILLILAMCGTALGITRICSKRFIKPFEDGSWKERIAYYETATDAFLHSPIWGIGVGSNFSWQAKYWAHQSRVVHSVPLLVLSETGLVGFVIFTVMIGLWLKYLWVCMHSFDVTPYLRGISLAMFAFSIGYIVLTLTVGEFEAFQPWLVMAVASAIKNLHMPPAGRQV